MRVGRGAQEVTASPNIRQIFENVLKCLWIEVNVLLHPGHENLGSAPCMEGGKWVQWGVQKGQRRLGERMQLGCYLLQTCTFLHWGGKKQWPILLKVEFKTGSFILFPRFLERRVPQLLSFPAPAP